jgi:hypothetical protein
MGNAPAPTNGEVPAGWQTGGFPSIRVRRRVKSEESLTASAQEGEVME